MNSTPKRLRPERPKPRLPRGFMDRGSEELRALDAMIATIKAIFDLYGFDPLATPLFEYTDALGKFLPDSERPNEGVFSVPDDDKQWLSLRYDLTAPLARHVAENRARLVFPYRTYRCGDVLRNEKPGPGRFRQFLQCDADAVGVASVTADAEMCMMMADAMEALGLARGDYVVRVGSRAILDELMRAAGLDGDDKAIQRLTVLRAMDKLDKFGPAGVALLLGEGRKDDSGDFTPGAGLTPAQRDRILAYISGDSDLACQASEDLDALLAFTAIAGYGPEQIRADPSVVRGLAYYTGAIYECDLLFPVTNDKGETVRFGAVAGGGRYDGLIARFTGQKTPAAGFSIGVSRLLAALDSRGTRRREAVIPPVLVCVMDRDAAALGRYQQMVKELRASGLRAELYHGNARNFGKQLNYADRRGCPLAIIEGADERSQGVVQIKDLAAGARQAGDIASRDEWVAARPAQVAVAREQLAARVAAMLKDIERSDPADRG